MAPYNPVEDILNRVRDQGAEGDLIIDAGQALSLTAKDGALEEHKATSSQVFGLRVIKDERVGTAYSEAADPASLGAMVNQALENAAFAGIEPFEKILPNDFTLETDDQLLAPADTASIEEKVALALRIEADLSERPDVKSVPYNGVQDVRSERFVYSTSGLEARSGVRNVSCYAYALMEANGKNAMEGVGQVARQFAQLTPESLIEQAYSNTRSMLDGAPVPSGKYDAIFDEEVLPRLFSVFAMMFSGKSAKEGVNPMRDKLGEVIAHPQLTLYDHPLNVDGFGYALFDGEGTPTARLPLIDQGVLSSMIHNSMTAGYFGLTSTGHATRGPKSTLGVGLHQLEIAAGNVAQRTLVEGDYLLITDLTGLHSGANSISGEFSFGASGYLCKDGERVQAVRGVTVAGNFYELIQRIEGIGSTRYRNWEKSALMPRIRFSNLAVSG